MAEEASRHSQDRRPGPVRPLLGALPAVPAAPEVPWPAVPGLPVLGVVVRAAVLAGSPVSWRSATGTVSSELTGAILGALARAVRFSGTTRRPNSGQTVGDRHKESAAKHDRNDGQARKNVTGSSTPSQSTVCWAGVVRAITLPPRSTSVRGATSRTASASDGASNTTRSAGPPGTSP